MINLSVQRNLWAIALLLFVAIVSPIVSLMLKQPIMPNPTAQLLTDPFLQLPTANSVQVVWFTEFPGQAHTVSYGQNFQQQVVAKTSKLSRTQEDQYSLVGEQKERGQVYAKPTPRDIWRHEAIVPNLTPGERIPYKVSSTNGDGMVINSREFTLAPAPVAGQPLKILLTSDHQLMPMTAANLQKVQETIGRVDGVFFAGDLQNVPDRASEWFDDNRGGAFFPCLQGRASYQLEKNGVKTIYKGGEIIQHTPLFASTGNHEVMGLADSELDLNQQFNDPRPRAAATQLYNAYAPVLNPKSNPAIRENFIKNNSYNTDTFREILSLPRSKTGDENYYAVSFGDIRLVSLYVTNLWRTPDPKARGRFQEQQADLNNPQNWGYGQIIFESIQPDSPQYQWLVQELNSPEWQQAKYKIVMFHHPPHSLGGNIVPPYTDPVQAIDRNDQGKITAVRYSYPQSKDQIIQNLLPLLEKAGTHLVFYGHTHIWNRFVSKTGMNFLESSNVGNTYGAYTGDKKRPIPDNSPEKYVLTGNPNGLSPVIPSLAPVMGEDGQPLPYLSSNDITAFSLLDTATGLVSSYRFDTREPKAEVIKFDEFPLNSRT